MVFPMTGVSVRRFNWSQFALPIASVFVIVMLIVPLPPPVLDLLIVFNIAAALVILLVAIYVQHLLENQ